MEHAPYLEPHPKGCLIRVRVQPKARRRGIHGGHADTIKVAVFSPPEKGKANREVAAVLSESLCLKKSEICLVSGQTSQNKLFLIAAEPELVAERLRSLLANG